VISGYLPSLCNDVSTTELRMRYVGVVINDEQDTAWKTPGTTGVQISPELYSYFKNCIYLTRPVIIFQTELHLNYI
jgi:hypothetical protein